MILTFISDTHSLHDNLVIEPGDILIHCGDFTNKGSLEDTANFARFMAKQNFKHKIVIAGNHDFCFEDDRKKEAEQYFTLNDVIYLNDSGIERDGLKIWGSPVQPEFLNWAFNRERGDDIRKHWKLIPDDTDILLTHGPAFGILDRVLEGDNVGCVDLLDKIKQIKPKIHAFGHIHESCSGLSDTDCRYMVDLLVLADNYHCEAALGRYVLNEFEVNRKPSIKQCRKLFSLSNIEMPVIVSQQHNLNSYDCLMGDLHG